MYRKNQTKHVQRNLWLILCFIGLSLLIAILTAAGGQQTVTAASVGVQTADDLWQDVDEAMLRVAGERQIVPTAYRVVALDWTRLNDLLANTPESAAETASIEVILSLPLPDGTYGRFQISQTAVMHPDLAAKFPEIQTYAGIGLDDSTAYVRLDTTPKGFHAMILSVNGRVFIDPYSTAGIDLYQSYYANDFVPNLPDDFAPDVVVEPEGETAVKPETIAGVNASSGGTLRTYRLAVAATGEYTQFHGGTKPLAMAEIVTAINRVTGIYEREVAVSFQLIANNDLVVYTDSATDPYTNNDGFAMLSQNQSTLNSFIGAANYDIGHVFSTGGGGIASLGVVCGSSKAQGVTGRFSPIGDPFYVDYVSHEMGHQFAGNHTFNSVTSSCGGPNRNGSTAYEPGSGSTIMAYAGICGSDDLQNNSDDYFHSISFDEIVFFTTAGLGNSCAATSNTGNTPPTVDAGVSYSIPLNTPFTLTGSASDSGGSGSLTYNWEEFDFGPAGAPNSPSGNAPIFRSFPATLSSSRTFPQILDIVNNTQTLGEILPSYGRIMNFRLTVRDNQTPAGGVAYDSTTVTAVSGTGPFEVTSPNTAVVLAGNANQTITWDVAGTTAAPISCANVAISLSTDGGFTYPTVLAASTPNDGSQSIFMPNINTSSARVRVSCPTNIFFDISDANFTIQGDPSLAVTKSVNPTGNVAPGETLTYSIEVHNAGGPANNTTVTDTFVPALVNPVCNGLPGDLVDLVAINPGSSMSYTCTADVDPSLALAVDVTAVPAVIESGEQVTYTITVTNSHSSLSLNNVQVSAPNVSGCTPALGTSQTLAPGASQTYNCPNVVVNSPAATTVTATGNVTISNVANASEPDDPGGPKSSSMVQNQVLVTSKDTFAVYLSDYFYLYLPIVTR